MSPAPSRRRDKTIYQLCHWRIEILRSISTDIRFSSCRPFDSWITHTNVKQNSVCSATDRIPTHKSWPKLSAVCAAAAIATPPPGNRSTTTISQLAIDGSPRDEPSYDDDAWRMMIRRWPIVRAVAVDNFRRRMHHPPCSTDRRGTNSIRKCNLSAGKYLLLSMFRLSKTGWARGRVVKAGTDHFAG